MNESSPFQCSIDVSMTTSSISLSISGGNNNKNNIVQLIMEGRQTEGLSKQGGDS